MHASLARAEPNCTCSETSPVVFDVDTVQSCGCRHGVRDDQAVPFRLKMETVFNLMCKFFQQTWPERTTHTYARTRPTCNRPESDRCAGSVSASTDLAPCRATFSADSLLSSLAARTGDNLLRFPALSRAGLSRASLNDWRGDGGVLSMATKKKGAAHVCHWDVGQEAALEILI